MKKRGNKWLLAFYLSIPVLIFFAGYLFNHTKNYEPTGFTMDDNVLYIAYAKQYLDADTFSFFYTNPFNDSGNYAPIYFQTQTILLALLLKTGIPAGYIMLPFTWVFSLLSFRVVIEIVDNLLPVSKYRLISIILFCWGGGLLALSGIPVNYMFPPDGQDFFDRMFFLDPGWGWWGLNFGRSLFITCEAYYHFLFMLTILFILKNKWLPALISLCVLSLSHPFTGIELLSIASGWVFTEKIFFKNKSMPWYFIIGSGMIFSFHLFYYLYYLNTFPDHQSISEQFSVNWRIRFFNMIPAYIIVGSLAFINIFRFNNAKEFFQKPFNRLFICWFIIALLLANHELFMRPVQPIHFTRGYIWTSLFLLALPGLPVLFEKIKKLKFGNLYYILLIFIFLSDNFLWITNYVRFANKSTSVMYISDEQKNILSIINKNADNKTLLISPDYEISFLSAVYSKAWPLVSNPYTTPFNKKKRENLNNFLKSGMPDSSWLGRKTVFVLNNKDNVLQRINTNSTEIASTENYRILKSDSLIILKEN